jgi:long-chain acyl-CoA synthetase
VRLLSSWKESVVVVPSWSAPELNLDFRQEVLRCVADRTLCTEFLRVVAQRPDEVCLRRPDGADWRCYSWSDYAERVGLIAAGLRRLGLARGENVAILCRNRPEFHFVDLGVLFAGGTPLSLYNSSPPEQIAYTLGHSGATLLVVEDHDFLERVLEIRHRLPRLRHIIMIEPAQSPRSGVISLQETAKGPPLDLDEAAAQVRPQDAATILYTSGTTGTPKGVVLSHQNLCYAVEVHARVSQLPLAGLRQLSYLPMAHIGERLITHYYHLIGGSMVTTCASLEELPATMAKVRPQWFFGAPRMWEKLRASVETELLADPSRRQRFNEALALGWRMHCRHSEGDTVPAELDRDWNRARDEVVSPPLAKIGLDDVVLAITGAAPLAPDTLRFFLSCGVKISDVYGSSETSGFMAWDPHHIVPGTSGKPLPGLEMKLADDGEIVVRGPNVFRGYLHDPERTAEALTEDGWYHTGDVGAWDADGNLSVIDRKKEILVPTSGHKVSPVQLESAIKRECALIGQACAIGDARSYISMILVLEPDLAQAWARQRGLAALTLAELANSAEVRAVTDAAVTRVNARLAPAERIRAYVVVGDLWLPDSDLLTPTAKMKRRAVHARYVAEIEWLYSDGGINLSPNAVHSGAKSGSR